MFSVLPYVMNALQGHSEQGMAGPYGDGQYKLELLREAVACIDDSGWDLGPIAGID